MVPIESTTTESIHTGSGIVGVIVLIGGTANSEVTLDDSLTGSGTDKIRLKALAYDTRIIEFPETGVQFNTGIYSTISGAGARVFVYLK